MDYEKLKYKIGIGLIPKVGPVLIKRLVDYCGSVEDVFNEKPASLVKIPGIGKKLVDYIVSYKNSGILELEIEFIIKNSITPLFYLDNNYPERLKQCNDAPIIIYKKGKTSLERSKVISIVGTRNPTNYGRSITVELVENIAIYYPDTLIVSGLAYGIDIYAHRTALKNNLDTLAVMGHGLATVYPSLHRGTADQIAEKGALISEFMHHMKPESANFVKRNRIIAGLSDATIVVESGHKGGALITADIAGSYNRDVFAVPGRACDRYSNGCNNLIKSNRAAMAENLRDIEYMLGWQRQTKQSDAVQKELFVELDQDETILMKLLNSKSQMTIDQMAINSNLPVSKVSTLLLNLEFKGLVKSLPGKIYSTLN